MINYQSQQVDRDHGHMPSGTNEGRASEGPAMQDRFGRPNYFNGAVARPPPPKWFEGCFVHSLGTSMTGVVVRSASAYIPGTASSISCRLSGPTTSQNAMSHASRLTRFACWRLPHRQSKGSSSKVPPTPAQSVAWRAARLLSEGETEGLSLSPHQNALLFCGAPA